MTGPLRLAGIAAVMCAICLPPGDLAAGRADSLLAGHVLVTWYGNPHSRQMGVLGEHTGAERAEALRRQAGAYDRLTSKPVVMAYQLVSVVAQCTAGADGKYRRRESADVIQTLLDEARANGFMLVLDVQVGRSTVADEIVALRPFLAEPDVHLALDPEFAVGPCEVPGKQIGELRAADVNVAIDELERLVAGRNLPPKILILHRFRWDMLPDKSNIRRSATVDLVLNMDGFGSQSLKLSSYRAIMKQGALPFAGIKLFYRQDTHLFSPAEVMGLTPTPSVIIYQ